MSHEMSRTEKRAQRRAEKTAKAKENVQHHLDESPHADERKEKVNQAQRSIEEVQSWTWVRFLRSGITLFNNRRCFGMATEGAFWLIFTLPFLVIGLLSASIWASRLFGEESAPDVEAFLVDSFGRYLTPEAVNDYVIPLFEQLTATNYGATIIGLGSALWSGSRVFATLGQGAVLINGLPLRGYLRNRGWAILTYLTGLTILVCLVAGMIALPDLTDQVARETSSGSLVGWIFAIALFSTISTTLIFVLNPRRTRWRSELPGGILMVIGWVLGSIGLQIYLVWIGNSGSVYGVISGLIAVMIWALIFTTSAFAGMTLNQTIRYAKEDIYLTKDVFVESDTNAYESMIELARQQGGLVIPPESSEDQAEAANDGQAPQSELSEENPKS